LSGFATAMIVIVALCLVGGGVYYFTNQEAVIIPDPGTFSAPPTSDNLTNSSTLKILDVTIQATTQTANIIWITNIPSTGLIEIRDADGNRITSAAGDSLNEKQTVTVSALQPGTKYNYTVTATDSSGNEVTSDGELITQAVADDNPPVISGASVSNITESSAIVTWTTNEPATGQVKYFVSDNTTSNSTTLTTPEDTNLNPTHSVMLSNLTSGTEYGFDIISKDNSGNVATYSEGQTFTTVAAIPFAAEEGSRAPDFELKNLSNQPVKLSDFKGKMVLLNFWAYT